MHGREVRPNLSVGLATLIAHARHPPPFCNMNDDTPQIVIVNACECTILTVAFKICMHILMGNVLTTCRSLVQQSISISLLNPCAKTLVVRVFFDV